MLQSKFHRFAIVVIILCVAALILYGSHKKGISLGQTHSTSTMQTTDTEHGDPSSKKVYLHGDNSFTFSFPGDFNFSNLAETTESGAQAETVLFVGSDANRNFQIHISSYNDKAPITAEMIKRDIPDLLIESPERIGVDGAQGVAFISGPKDGTLRTREIWFAYNGKLYQISTYQDFDNQMVDILASWKW